MRLAVFTSKYPARVATFFERDMRALIEAGIEIEVFSLYPLDATLWKYATDVLGEQHLPRDRVHHLSNGESLRAAGRVLRSDRRARRDARALLASARSFGAVPFAKTAYVLPKSWTWAVREGRRFDHVLGYWGNYAGSGAWAFHRLVGRDVPFSIWLHAGTDLYRTPVFLREKLAWADNVITCCDFNRTYILKSWGGEVAGLEDKVHVCHHGLDLAGFPFKPGGRPERLVMAVGRLSPHKGFDDLLRAAAVLAGRSRRVDIELVGDGDERRRLEYLANELGIAENVRFRGWLPFAEARAAMARATLLVHPSPGLGDGLPNVIREAMALGTPVVATAVAGIPDALGDGRGVLVPPRDVGALAAAIERLIAQPAERRALAEAARRHVEQHYDLWKNGAALADRLRSTQRGRVNGRTGPLAAAEAGRRA